MRNLGGMMAGPNAPAAFPQGQQATSGQLDIGRMAPEEVIYESNRTRTDPVLSQSFPDLSDPSSIAWTIGSMMRNGVLPPESTLQQLSDYVSLQNQFNPAFMNPQSRLFGALGGDYSIYDDVMNAPPGQKQQAFVNAQNRVYANSLSNRTGRKTFPRLQMPQPAPGLEARMAPARFPAQPPVAPGASVFNDPSYMQMAEQQLRQGGF